MGVWEVWNSWWATKFHLQYQLNHELLAVTLPKHTLQLATQLSPEALSKEEERETNRVLLQSLIVHQWARGHNVENN